MQIRSNSLLGLLPTSPIPTASGLGPDASESSVRKPMVSNKPTALVTAPKLSSPRALPRMLVCNIFMFHFDMCFLC